MRGRTMAAFAALLAVLGATAVGTALAATPTGGKVRMFFTYQTPTKDKALITGAVADYGTAISQDANGKVNPNGNFEKVTLKHGTFLINATALNKAIQKQFSKQKINPDNCSLALIGSGPSTFEKGTGAYAGISGKLTITLTVAGIAPKTKNGRCNLSNSAPFYGQYQGVTATGTVSLG